MVYDPNIALYGLINGLAGKSGLLDGTMVFLAKYLVYLVPFYLIYLWFRDKVAGKAGIDGRMQALFIFSATVVSLLVGWIIGFFYFHPRPFMLGLGTLLIQYAPDSSFPSDHALILFSVMFTLFFLRRYWQGLCFAIMALAVGFARIYCGLHFPLDIAGSLAVSLIVAIILFSFKGQVSNLFSEIIKLASKIS